MREFFQRVEDGVVNNIEIEMDAFAYSEKFSWLFSVFVQYDPKNNSEESYEEFLETKESLIIALEHKQKVKFVGMRVVDGWSEFYFYAGSPKELNATVSKMLNPSKYVHESSAVKDKKWDFHFKNLSPTELELAHMQSEKIIFLLKEEGDDLSIVRPVEHYFSFQTPTQKNRFINTIDLEGVVFKDEIDGNEFEHGAAFIKEHSVTSEKVKVNVDLLYNAVKKENGFYEGWSTILAVENL